MLSIMWCRLFDDCHLLFSVCCLIMCVVIVCCALIVFGDCCLLCVCLSCNGCCWLLLVVGWLLTVGLRCPMFLGHGLLLDMCCLLGVDCCLLCAVCSYLVFVVCCMLPVAFWFCLLFVVACCLLSDVKKFMFVCSIFNGNCLSFVVRCPLFVICCVSCVGLSFVWCARALYCSVVTDVFCCLLSIVCHVLVVACLLLISNC